MIKTRCKNLAEIYATIPDFELIDIGCKYGVYLDEECKEEKIITDIVEKISTNPEKILELYSRKSIECLEKIIVSDDMSQPLTFDYASMSGDGILDTIIEDDNKKIYLTDDFKDAYCSIGSIEDRDKIASEYEEICKIIIGIINYYGFIEIDDIFDIFKKITEVEMTENEFYHFCCNREELISNFNRFEYKEDDYLYIDEIDDDDIEELIRQKEAEANAIGYKKLTKSEYIEIANIKVDVLDTEEANCFKEYFGKILSEKNVKDLFASVVYDIRTNNIRDLLLDVTTYYEIATEEEHKEIEKLLKELTLSLPIWVLKGNKISNVNKV